MFSMLIVDDEKFAAEGIQSCTDWQVVGIEFIHLAYHAREAKEILNSNRIDVMICDIEMPDENGLELVGWVKERYPDTETVFLTCHTEFSYAKQAVQLGTFDYLLKPVNDAELVQVVSKMLEAVKEKEEQKHFNEMYKKNQSLWIKQQPVRAENFWQDFLSRRILSFGDFLERSLHDAELPLSVHDQVLPVLISIEKWLRPLNDRDQEIMEYAVKKAAEELFLETHQGNVILDKNGLLFAMIYMPNSAESNHDLHYWKEAAQKFIDACLNYFFCSLSCYIGDFVPFQELHAMCDSLQQMERTNLTVAQTAIFYQKQTIERQITAEPVYVNVSGWIDYLHNGNKDKLIELIQKTVIQLEATKKVNAELIETYYHDILQIFYHFLHVKGIGVNQVPNFSLWTSAKIRSLTQLQNWAINLASSVIAAAFVTKEDDGVITKAIQYMREHVEEDISREDVAAHVFLNSAYLSRLFRRETDKKFIDYLTELKMIRAKELLDNTDSTVSGIAQQLGYVNFSHFSKLFKKMYGLNPEDYLKR